MEYAGVVAAVGPAVTEFSVGEEVFGVKGSGANAEYTIARATGAIAPKPTAMTFQEAAAVCDGACIARACLAKADLREGKSIVIYGASGSIGTAAVQIAKHQGAHVTAVCNTKNVDLVRSLGADEVVDYLQEDFTRNGETYDVVFDAVGKHSFLRCRRSRAPGGRYITTDPGFMWHDALVTLFARRAKLGIVRYRKEDLVALTDLLARGAYRPVIDSTYPLEDVVDAHRRVETHEKTGSVVLAVG